MKWPSWLRRRPAGTISSAQAEREKRAGAAILTSLVKADFDEATTQLRALAAMGDRALFRVCTTWAMLVADEITGGDEGGFAGVVTLNAETMEQVNPDEATSDVERAHIWATRFVVTVINKDFDMALALFKASNPGGIQALSMMATVAATKLFAAQKEAGTP